MALVLGSRLGPYEILAAIGAGGMGEVYRARDTRLNRDVAVKVIAAGLADSPDALARFEREARAVAALAHPNILALHDVGLADGISYAVAELLDGESLRDALRTGPLPLRRAVDYAVQIASGLAAAHDKGIVHRDLKPENVFVTTTGSVKILDFGLATQAPPKVNDETHLHERHTATAVILGTAGYMAPEQVRGEPVDHRADVFSFGAMVYEMLAGRRAFQRDTPAESMLSVLRDDPPPFGSDISPAVRRIVLRCLEKRREARFQSAHDLAFAFKAFSQSEPSVDNQSTAPFVNRVAWASAAVLVLTAGLATLLYTQRAGSATPSDVPEIRLELTTPADSLFNAMSLSPDGTRLVYQARGQLWLRSLASMAPRPLTAGGENVFWSPDGQSIGFFHEKKLNRLNVSTGVVQTLARAPEAIGGTWNADGTILFVPGLATSVRRVSANGGETSEVTRLVPGHTGHRFPQFLPDGNHFLYVVVGPPEIRGTYVASLDSPAGRRLIDSVFQPIFMAPDWLLYVTEGALVARKINLATLQLAGEPVQIASRVGINSPRYNGIAATAAAGRIAFRSHEGSFRVVWVDRQGKRLGTIGDPEDVAPIFVELSRDGRRAVEMRTVEGNSDVWLVDIDRGTRRRLTHDPARDSVAVWSPDGGDVFYANERTGIFGIFRVAVDGSGTESLVTSGAAPQIPTDVSADGRLLSFRQQNPAGGDTLWTLRLDGQSRPDRVTDTPFEQRAGRFSPDGKWIVYQSNETGQWEIYLKRLAGSHAAIPVSKGGGLAPFWRPDARELYFSDLQNHLIAVPLTLATESATIGTSAMLFDVGESDLATQTLDGERFLMVERTAPPPPITLVLNWAGGHR
jgi:serine/threonine protein kinase